MELINNKKKLKNILKVPYPSFFDRLNLSEILRVSFIKFMYGYKEGNILWIIVSSTKKIEYKL